METQRAARSGLTRSTREKANLTALLRAHNWILWNRPLQQQQMTVQQLSSLTFADLGLAVPTVPSGVLLQIQSAACEWMHREAETLESQLNKISSMSLAGVPPCLFRFAFSFSCPLPFRFHVRCLPCLH